MKTRAPPQAGAGATESHDHPRHHHAHGWLYAGIAVVILGVAACVVVFTAPRTKSGTNFKIPNATPAPPGGGPDVPCSIGSQQFCDELLGEDSATSDCGQKFTPAWLNNSCQVDCAASQVVVMLQNAKRLEGTPSQARSDPSLQNQACSVGLSFQTLSTQPKSSSDDPAAQGKANFYASVAACIGQAYLCGY